MNDHPIVQVWRGILMGLRLSAVAGLVSGAAMLAAALAGVPA